MKSNYTNYKIKSRNVFILLVLLVLSTYSNTFQASFHLDDEGNILDNKRLHITDLSPGSLWKTFFAKGGTDEFSRPLPSLSFALNWYAGKINPFGYHIVNIAIHILTAFFLYLTISALLKTRKVKAHYKENDVYFIALLSTVLWAINPIQIQAVTYIVQRMASMAAMFYILGIYFYIRARQSENLKNQVQFYMACFFSYMLALMSKENTATLPLSLFLIEIIFYQNLNILNILRKHWVRLTGAMLMTIFLMIVVFKTGVLDYHFRGFSYRPFTLWERLITEPRIVLFYISQIFYPTPARLSITHDIVVSKSLLSPWTTLPAMLTILFLIGVAFSLIKKRPLVAFAILFFFLNHVIESTVLPLELIFEHRNYLPSLFVFLPVASGLWYLFKFYQSKNRCMVAIMATSMTLVIIALGCFTYIRNLDWRTEVTLWRDAMKKAPLDARPVWNLALALAWDKNVEIRQIDVALFLLEKALSLNQSRKFRDASILRNMGLLYYALGSYDEAIEVYKKSLEIDPYFVQTQYDLIASLMMKGNLEEAMVVTNRTKLTVAHFRQKGFILLWQKRPEKALKYLRNALEYEPNNSAVLLNTGVALSLMGRNKNSELFLKKAAKSSPRDIRPVYALIENSIRAGNNNKAEEYAEQMFAKFSVKTIQEGLEKYSENYRSAPMSSEFIMPVVKNKMMQLLQDMETPTPKSSLE